MMGQAWEFVLAIYRDDGTPVGQFDIDVDWVPADQWVRLLALRRGVTPLHATGEVQPLRRKRGGPAMIGFRVCMQCEGGGLPVCCEFGNTYFTRAARQLSALLRVQGRLAADERFMFVPLAYLRSESRPTERDAPRFRVTDATPPPVVRERTLPPSGIAVVELGETWTADVPMFVQGSVLDEIAALTRRAGGVETGGVLVGDLCRDRTQAEVFGRITAQIPAEGAIATATSLSLSSDTWTAMRRALEARASDEQMLGWWHSHPVRHWCAADGCQRTGHDDCASAAPIFSERDEMVHRTVFPAAHTVALVANEVSDTNVSFAVYGWRMGTLQRRGMHVVAAAGWPCGSSGGVQETEE